MRRRAAVIIALFVVALAIGVSGAWFYFVQQTHRAIDRWVERQRALGVDVSWQAVRFRGFPLRVEARFDAPQLAMHRGGRDVVWQPERLRLSVWALAPHSAAVISPGIHQLRISGEGGAWSGQIDARRLDARATFAPGGDQRIERLTVQFVGVRVSSEAWTAPVTIARGTLEATQRPPGPANPTSLRPQGVSLDTTVNLNEIRLPNPETDANALATLGDTIASLTAQARVLGDLDPARTDAAALAAWRDAGGTADFPNVALLWGPLRVSGDGTGALDENLQPEGAFSARVAGLEDLVTALEKAGKLSPSDAAVARITLAVLTRPADDGGPNRAELPITLQDRILRLGPIAVLQLPPIDWR